MRGATAAKPFPYPDHVISIHAPHAGSDIYNNVDYAAHVISIHAPHAGSDATELEKIAYGELFQSTLPMRGATRNPADLHHSDPDFNPRSPCGERLNKSDSFAWVRISIHAPHAGSDKKVGIKSG